MFAEGTIVDDSYEVQNHLGLGGMGSVYSATEIGSGKQVALKILSLELARDREWRARFLRESKALSVLEHPYIVRVHRLGVWQGLPYIAMELLNGKSLRQLILDQQRITWRDCVSAGMQICEGMQFAHSCRIIHRDLKPENVMLCATSADLDCAPYAKQHVKILDFGLSRIAGTTTTRSVGLTKVGTVIGSIHYMSPEQCLGSKADFRADVYALGCLLYECLTGTVPFDAENAISLMHKHVSEQPAPFASAIKNEDQFPTVLEAVVLKAMSKKPEDRYQTMDQMRKDLESINNGELDQVRASLRSNGGGFLTRLWKSLLAACQKTARKF